MVLSDLTFHLRKKIMHDVKMLFWDEPYLYQICADRVIRHCVPKGKMLIVLEVCHSSPVAGHNSGI